MQFDKDYRRHCVQCCLIMVIGAFFFGGIVFPGFLSGVVFLVRLFIYGFADS